MASIWTKLAGASQWFCEPQRQPKAKNCQRVVPDESSSKTAKSASRSAAQKKTETELFEALLANRLYMERKQSALEEEISQLQSSLEETRYMLHHSQRVCEELQAQLKDEKRTRERQQHYMKEQLDSQTAELEDLGTELEKAHAALQQQKEELHRQVQENDGRAHKMSIEACAARKSETNLLRALMERAATQLSVREEPSPVQKLRTELEVARFMLSEEQEAADELRRKLQCQESMVFELEQFAELQRSNFLHEHRRHKDFEADVEKFLQHLGQRHPGIARDLAMTCADLPAPYGAGGG